MTQAPDHPGRTVSGKKVIFALALLGIFMSGLFLVIAKHTADRFREVVAQAETLEKKVVPWESIRAERSLRPDEKTQIQGLARESENILAQMSKDGEFWHLRARIMWLLEDWKETLKACDAAREDEYDKPGLKQLRKQVEEKLINALPESGQD